MTTSPLSAQTDTVSKCTTCLQDPAACAYIERVKLYVPAFRFGSLWSAEAVSVGINPAENECGSRELPILSDFQQVDRTKLSAQNLDHISNRADQYFSSLDAHPWFKPLQKILWTINPRWTYGRKVAHTDVISCVTDPTFGKVIKSGQDALLKNCRDHFLNTLRLLPPNCWIICDGKTALNEFETGGRVRKQDNVGRVRVVAGSFALGGKALRFAGWNYPAEKVRSDDQKREVAAMARGFIKSSPEW